METIEYKIGSCAIILDDEKLVIIIPREYWTKRQWRWLVNIIDPVSRSGADVGHGAGDDQTTREFRRADATLEANVHRWVELPVVRVDGSAESSSAQGSTPFLTDTVTVMPTDIFVYLPLVLR